MLYYGGRMFSEDFLWTFNDEVLFEKTGIFCCFPTSEFYRIIQTQKLKVLFTSSILRHRILHRSPSPLLFA
jgi:hypothetical protein